MEMRRRRRENNKIEEVVVVVDCEQSVFSSDLVRVVHAHASAERRSCETRETRTAALERLPSSSFSREIYSERTHF